MAKVVDDSELTQNFPVIYPWADWFDGQTWELTQGEDFNISVINFRAVVYGAGRRQGIKVKIGIRETRLLVRAILRTT